MKYLILFGLVACASAGSRFIRSVAVEKDVPIVKSDYQLAPDGNFRYAYETGNGIYAEASGVLKNANTENAAYEITGNVKYTSPEGQTHHYTYVANENGYQPQGDILPTPPPVPDYIARSLEYIAAHPNKESQPGHVQPPHVQPSHPPSHGTHGTHGTHRLLAVQSLAG